MTILYVAGPMTGLPDLNYPAFNKVQQRLEKDGYDVLNPAQIDNMFPLRCERPIGLTVKPMRLKNCGSCRPCTERTWQWYMRKAVVMLVEADGVALLPHWHRSRGATAEVALAQALQMPALDWHHWVGPKLLLMELQQASKEGRLV